MKKFIFKFIVFSILVFLPIALINYYLLKPYGVFNYDTKDVRGTQNSHYRKMHYLLNNKTSYDSYIFGSSRVGQIYSDKIPAGEFYNLSYPTGTTSLFLKDIRIIFKKG